ncbi:MAG TPA: hypothetical protein VN711_04520, partial [Candidatus Saccharimonadales bacterium]|nr:hypothetical protein [Candidatus Saccharimonadales bacterium]
YFLLFGEYDRKTKWTIFSWYLLAPVAASVTTGVPHAVRALNFLPTYQIFSAIGIISVVGLFKKRKILFAVVSCLVVLIAVLNIAYYLDQYFVQTNYYTAYDWQYGYAQAVPYVASVEDNYQKIVVSNQPPLDQSYMFFLFYLRYNPALYQYQSEHASGGFREDHYFGKYEFRSINWNNESKKIKTLYVGRPSDFPSSADILKVVDYPNGDPAVEVATF